METVTRPAPTLAGVDIAALSTDQLEDGICGFAARLAAATCAFVLAVAEYDRRGGWETWECRSMAQWLTWKCAMGPVAAREHVRIGAALAELGLVRERFAAGALSYSQVRAITRVATTATESDLVDLADAMTASQLETVVRAYRRARPDVTDPGDAPHARRTLSICTDDDGSLVGTFRLAPEDGAVFVAALTAATDRRTAEDAERADPHTGSGAGEGSGDAEADDPTLDPAGAVHADALMAMAGAYLDRPTPDSGDGEHGSGDVGDRYVVSIIAERRVLESTADDRPDGVCQIDDGPGLDPDVVRRLACEAPTETILEDQFGHVLDVGRRTRRVNRALRRALTRRDGGCQYPGCTTRRIQAHHVEHWIDGGPTSMANLISLCSRHHHRHHEGAFRIDPAPGGGWSFTRADGRPIPSAATRPSQGIDADPGIEPSVVACTPNWEGDALSDLSGIVDGLLRSEGLLIEAPLPPPRPDLAPYPLSDIASSNNRTEPDRTESAHWPSPWPDPWGQPHRWPGE
ncbi:MAG: HNH endonuclease [Actinomycetota bacterium]|nr:HNH endonuclease [Actinomycetota bacterium]